MITQGVGVYFDGQTSRRQDVHVTLADSLVLTGTDGRRLVDWPFEDLRELPGPAGVLRLNRAGGPPLARLELRDAALVAETRRLGSRLGDSRRAESGTVRKVVAWSLAAVVSITLFGFYGVPAIADRVTPLLPWTVDQRMGEAADEQVRMFFAPSKGDFTCGDGADEKAGQAALDRLAKRMSDAAALPVPITIRAARSDFVNALALPGSPIYLFDGLIQKAKSGDELAGVLAHEIAHVAHRDGTRRTVQAGGASLLFGFIFGDFVGGTTAILVAQVLVDAHYSRDAERAADAYGVELMKKLGADGRAVGTLLTRLSLEEDDGGRQDDKPDAKPKEQAGASRDGETAKPRRSITDWLSSHPDAIERQKAIDRIAGDAPTTPIMDDADFLAVRRICGQPK